MGEGFLVVLVIAAPIQGGSIIFHTDGVKVASKYLLTKLHQYSGTFGKKNRTSQLKIRSLKLLDGLSLKQPK